ncbi:hypothetical protein CBS101457_006133 [Exobasidium rhododendri]|nr:hypothetical protein CBS101457_006133 [Exobasidium rhododendri]
MAVSVVSVDFTAILAELEADKDLQETIREHQKELDRSTRSITTVLNKIHSTPSRQGKNVRARGGVGGGPFASTIPDLIVASPLIPLVHTIVEQTVPLFSHSRNAVRSMVDIVPANQYYKWNDSWSFGLQRAAYSAALTFYLATGRLIKKEQIAEILDIRSEESHKFQISTEEYLHSVVSVVNELSRLAVNSVTLGDFGTPLRLSAFVKDLHAGFQLLNLKNDSLRKRFDSIKYDVKKIEEVVYDISLRGLIKPDEASKGVGLEVDDTEVADVMKLLTSGAR